MVTGACTNGSAPAQPSSSTTAVDSSLTASVTAPRPLSPAAGALIRNADQPATLVVANATITSGSATYTFEVATDAAFASKVYRRAAWRRRPHKRRLRSIGCRLARITTGVRERMPAARQAPSARDASCRSVPPFRSTRQRRCRRPTVQRLRGGRVSPCATRRGRVLPGRSCIASRSPRAIRSPISC